MHVTISAMLRALKPLQSLKTFFYLVRHLDSIDSYLPTGLHLGFFHSRPSLFLPSRFLFGLPRALFCFGIHFNAILGSLPSAILWIWPYHVSWFCSISFIFVSSNPVCCLIFHISDSIFSWYSRRSSQGIHLYSFDPSFIIFCESPCFGTTQ